MAKTHQFFWLFFLFLSTTPPLSHSQLLSFVHHGFNGLTHNNITLTGSSYIQPNGILRLTNHTANLIGHAFYPNPIRFKFNNSTTGTPLSFSTAFAFAINCSQKRDTCGHGLAFTISPSPHFRNAFPSLYLGILNGEQNGNSSNHLFAVEFDTVQDFRFKDINNNHVGVDINSLKSIDSVSAGYVGDGNSSRNELNLMSGKTIQAWIDYDSHSNQLNVSVSPFSTKPSFPIISSNINLSWVFEETMYIGFSASTGVLSSNHYILGWSFSLNGQAQSLDLSSLPSLSNQKQKKSSLFIIYVSVSVFGFAVIWSVGLIVFCFIKKMRNKNVVESWELDIGPRRFSYKELKKATRGFRDKELLGFGGFGKVYEGTIHNSNTQVAVKRISHESNQGLSEFASEINTIGRLRHRNLVQLIGWCRRGADLLLVYEFMPNGSLDKYIFDKSKSILSWEQRFRIIKGVASGLLYLHEEWEQTVIHRDIKAGNVLLDSELNARLGDFGLAKLCNHGSNLDTTKVVGTLGYLAPELTRTGKPTKSSDVFAFGALLLEVVCGRRPIEAKALPEELFLVDWVWERWRREAVFEVVDPRLEGEYDEVEVAVVVKLGLMCSNSVPRKRPGMRQVVRWLEGEVGLPDVVLPPNEYDEKENGDSGSGSIKLSYFERISCYSSISDGGDNDNDDEIVDIEAGST